MNSILLVGNNLSTHLNFRLDLMKWLTSQGWDVCLACPYQDKDEDNTSINTLNANHIKLFRINMKAKGTNPFHDLLLIIQIYLLQKKLRPRITLNYTIKPIVYGGIASYLSNSANIAVITGAGYAFLNNDLKSKIARALYKWGLRCAHKVVFLNSEDLQMFIKNKLVNQYKCSLLPGEGIDLQHFIVTTRQNNARAPIKFLFIGRILYDKGIAEFVKAAEMLKSSGADFLFEVVGELGSNNPSAVSASTFKSWIDNGSIIYRGFSKDIRADINRADCVVLPSYREGLSRVLLEAAAMEKPIITSNVAGCREIVRDMETGLLVRPKNTEDLLNAMTAMANLSSEERIEMGKKARQLVMRHFSNQTVFARYKELLRDFE